MENLDRAVAVAFAVGLVVGAVGGVGYAGGPAPTDAGPDPESPGYSVSKSTGCLDVRPHAGWVHEVAVGDSFAVTLNATVVHERGQTVGANVSRVAPGSYRIDLRTVPETEETTESRAKTPPEDCPVATDLRLGTSLPTDYREFTVSVDGRTLLTVENEGTVGELFQLPNPVNATSGASSAG
jgi:hypothetical protein